MIEGSNVTLYVNDPTSGAKAERHTNGGTTTWRDYVFTDDGKLAALRSSVSGGATTWQYYIDDHLGSASVLTDASSNDNASVTERASYDAWGRRRDADGSDDTSCSLTSASPRGFTGHEHLESTCLINANARVYDPTIARFMAADPITADWYDGQGINRFSYVNNRPLVMTDPTGMAPGDVFATKAGAARDAFKYINGTSKRQNIEYAGRFYRTWFGFGSGWSYTEPHRGSRDHSNPGLCIFLACNGAYHTHGGDDPRYKNEIFSPADMRWADQTGEDIWLFTPKDRIKQYVPANDGKSRQGRETILQRDSATPRQALAIQKEGNTGPKIGKSEVMTNAGPVSRACAAAANCTVSAGF